MLLAYIQWMLLYCYSYSLKLHIDIRTVDAAVLLYSLKLHIDIRTVDAAVLPYVQLEIAY